MLRWCDLVLRAAAPLTSMTRAAGAVVHAAWLRWERWRVDMIWQDFKHALRTLKAQPGFAAVTLVTPAIGIGGTTAIFGAVNAVLLRPLPYLALDALVRVSRHPRMPSASGRARSAVALRLALLPAFPDRADRQLLYVVVAAGLLVVALLASWIPAWRASRIDPLRALRHD